MIDKDGWRGFLIRESTFFLVSTDSVFKEMWYLPVHEDGTLGVPNGMPLERYLRAKELYEALK